jgi:predicted transcriptional regulator
MELNELKNWIINNLLKNNNIISRKCRKDYLEKNNINIYNNIIYYTKFLENTCKLSERVYCILNNINSPMICNNKNCNKSVNFVCFSIGYKKYCCSTCGVRDEEIKNKIINTNLLRYGVVHYSKTQERRDRVINTCINKYGVDNPCKSKEIIKKIENNNIKKYGVKSVFQLEEVKRKIYNKIHNKINDIRLKAENTCLNKYGEKYYCVIPKCYKSGINSILKKYNGKYYSQVHISDESLINLNNKDWLKNQHCNLKKNCNKIAKELNVSQRTVLNYLHKFNIKIIRFQRSSYEQEIVDFINLPNILTNVRNIIPPYELDIYLPDYKLSIEFNGSYWHKGLEYRHKLKTNLCNKKGIKLIHISENEWNNDKDKCKNIIMESIKGNII